MTTCRIAERMKKVKFIEVSSIDSINVECINSDFNARLFLKKPFQNSTEKLNVLETALESLIDKTNSPEYDLVFKSPCIDLLINVEEISYMTEIVSTIYGWQPPAKYWRLMPRATEIILKDGTKKIVKESIYKIKEKIESIR